MAAARAPEALDPDEDVDALLEQLEEEDDVAARLREQRMLELQRRAQKLQELEQTDHGKYVDVAVEKELLRITTTEPFVVAHFCMPEYRRCKIVDAHMKELARRHYATRFVRVNVKDVPFLVDRLKIQVLPCIVSFVNGITVDRVVGFTDLGNTDNWPTELLEKRLRNVGVIAPTDVAAKDPRPAYRTGVYGGGSRAIPADDDD